MTSQIVSLLVVFLGPVLQSADAVSCYTCNYTDATFLGTSTCSEPFSATNIAKCSAPMCTWQLANYISPLRFKLVYRDCANDSTFKQTNRCELRSNEFSYTTFKYGDSCCYTTGLQEDDGTTYSQRVCFCQKDNCNGNIPLTLAPSSVAPTTAASTGSITTDAPTTVVTSSRYTSSNGSGTKASPTSMNLLIIASIVAGVIVIIVLLALGLAKAVKVKARAKGKSVDRRRTQDSPKDDPDYEMIDESNVQTGEIIATEGYASLTRSSSTQPATHTQLEIIPYLDLQCQIGNLGNRTTGRILLILSLLTFSA